MRDLAILAVLLCGCNGTDGPVPSDDTDTPLADLPDLDGDGVPDAWETAGYYAENGLLKEWKGETDVVVFRTDPTRISTDQDPYPDGMEATGEGMPSTVVSPGNHPLVPAFPNIVAVLEGYQATPTTEITLSTGRELSQSTSLSNETEQSTATTQTSETNYSVEASVNMTVDDTGVSGTVSATVGAGYGESSSTTEGIRTARAVGVSNEQRTEWSTATATNTGSAAELTMLVRYLNVGTDTAFDVLPTLSLRIGDRDVATFQPNTAINVLGPGEQHPVGVADAVEFTALGTPITLTLDDLALLEGGAPVTLTVSQLDADVVRREDDGTFTQQSWTGYGGAIGAVTSRLLFDDREGFQREVLVYADDDPTSPEVTLGQALAIAGVDNDGAGGLQVELESADGSTRDVSLEGWRFALDDTLWTHIGDSAFQPGFNPYDVRLIPGTVVRMHPQPVASTTQIYRTWWDDDDQLNVKVFDATYAAALLTVEGAVVGGGGATFEWDPSQLAFRSTNLNGLGFLYESPVEITARNPAAVVGGDPPVTKRVPTTSPFNQGTNFLQGLDTFEGFGDLGGARIGYTLNFEYGISFAPSWEGYPTGLSLRAFNPSDVGTPYYFDNRSDDSEVCRANLPDHPVESISSADLDACSWSPTYQVADGDLPTPVPGGSNTVLVVRYCESGCNVPDRMIAARTTFSSTGLDVDWVVYRLR